LGGTLCWAWQPVSASRTSSLSHQREPTTIKQEPDVQSLVDDTTNTGSRISTDSETDVWMMQRLQRIHELTTRMHHMTEEISQHTTMRTVDDFHQRIETTKHAMYTIPREFREPVAPVVRENDHDTSRIQGIIRLLFRWPWQRRRIRRRQLR
jgi:sulfite reductase alpha subunit-like flavoprotein